jgi:hypothetical protein
MEPSNGAGEGRGLDANWRMYAAVCGIATNRPISRPERAYRDEQSPQRRQNTVRTTSRSSDPEPSDPVRPWVCEMPALEAALPSEGMPTEANVVMTAVPEAPRLRASSLPQVSRSSSKAACSDGNSMLAGTITWKPVFGAHEPHRTLPHARLQRAQKPPKHMGKCVKPISLNCVSTLARAHEPTLLPVVTSPNQRIAAPTAALFGGFIRDPFVLRH